MFIIANVKVLSTINLCVLYVYLFNTNCYDSLDLQNYNNVPYFYSYGTINWKECNGTIYCKEC